MRRRELTPRIVSRTSHEGACHTTSNVIAFPNSRDQPLFDPARWKAITDMFDELRATGERDRRRQMRAAGPQGCAIDRATKRMGKAAKELKSAIDAVRVVAGLPSLGINTL